MPLGCRAERGNPTGAKSLSQEHPHPWLAWARIPRPETVQGPVQHPAEHLPRFTEPLLSLPPAAAAPCTQCVPCSSQARTSLSCCLLPLMVEKSTGQHGNTHHDKMGAFLLTELLLSLRCLEIHGRKAASSWYLVWRCDNLDRADVFSSSWSKIISISNPALSVPRQQRP